MWMRFAFAGCEMLSSRFQVPGSSFQYPVSNIQFPRQIFKVPNLSVRNRAFCAASHGLKIKLITNFSMKRKTKKPQKYH